MEDIEQVTQGSRSFCPHGHHGNQGSWATRAVAYSSGPRGLSRLKYPILEVTLSPSGGGPREPAVTGPFDVPNAESHLSAEEPDSGHNPGPWADLREIWLIQVQSQQSHLY